MSDNAQEWRWVGEDGVQKTVPEQELIAELSSESLPHYTLVWKKGWLEWLPVMQVAELAWALPPGKADDPVKPREKESAAQPPAPPLYRYPVIKRRAANLRTDKPPPPRAPIAAPRPGARKSEPPPALEPPTAVLAPLPPASETTAPRIAPLPAPVAVERPLDSKPVEEVEMETIESSSPLVAPPDDATQELQPIDEPEGDDEEEVSLDEEVESAPEGFGAVPARRGAFDAHAYSAEDEAETNVIPSRPPPNTATYVGPHRPPQSERPPPSYDEDAVPRFPAPPPPPADLSAYANAATREERRHQRRPIVTYVLGGLVLVLAVVVVVLLVRGGPSPEAPGEATQPSPSAAASLARPAASTSPATAAGHAEAARQAEEPLPAKTCTVLMTPTKVADWAEPSVVPSFAAIPGSSRVAVGFGQSETYAIGITIDPKTLDRDQVFREFRKPKLASVVPTTAGGKLRFQVARDGAKLENARVVDAATPFLLGSNESGIARIAGKGAAEPVWSFPVTEEVTVPRVAMVPGVGSAVTVRRGGKSGKVAVGWIDSSGRKRTNLEDVASPGEFVGTPTIASSDDGIFLAFATRGANDSVWSIALATARANAIPRTARRFPLPSGGPGGDGISPAASALSGGRWLLTWTEGSSGNRVVRAQVLGNDLSPLTRPISLSPDGANTGQSAVWANGSTGAVLYYLQNDKKSHELWGASLECPR